MNEDEQKQLETGASGATMTPPAPSVQPPPPPTGVGVDAFDAAESAATTAPGQSVVDAARNAETESQLRGVAQASAKDIFSNSEPSALDWYVSNKVGLSQPTSAWVQDMNGWNEQLAGLKKRHLEPWLREPQQEPAAAPVESKTIKTITVGNDGMAEVGGKKQTLDSMSFSFDEEPKVGPENGQQDELGWIFQ